MEWIILSPPMMLRGSFVFWSLKESLCSVFKNLKKKKKKKELLWDCQPAYLQDVSDLISPDGNWYDQNSVPSTLEYTWNIVKPTWSDEIEALNIFIYIQKEHIFIFTKPFKLVWIIKRSFSTPIPPSQRGPPISSYGLCVLFRNQ